MIRALQAPGHDAASTAFQRWWSSQGDWVEAPNQRRDGESGVQLIRPRDPDLPLLFCKRQVGHLYRSLRYPLGRPTVQREWCAISAFEQLGVRVPEIVYRGLNHKGGQWQALLVTKELSGFVSLENWYRHGAPARWGEAVHRAMLRELGAVLAVVHRARWQHGCCYPKHIFIRVQGNDEAARVEIALLDLEKSRRRLRRASASRHDLRQLYRHREDMPLADLALFQAAYSAAFTQSGARADAP